MLARLLRRRPAPNAAVLYGAILAAARRIVLFSQHGVPDTIEGRFESLVLHLALVLRRLEALGGEGDALATALVDVVFRELERTLRETGIGDTGIPKRMKRLLAAFHGRVRAYDAALAADDPDALAAAVLRNVFAGEPNARAGAVAVAGDARALDAALAAVDVPELCAGLLPGMRAEESVG